MPCVWQLLREEFLLLLIFIQVFFFLPFCVRLCQRKLFVCCYFQEMCFENVRIILYFFIMEASVLTVCLNQNR